MLKRIYGLVLLFLVLGFAVPVNCQDTLRERVAAKVEEAVRLAKERARVGIVPAEELREIQRLAEMIKDGKLDDVEKRLDEVIAQLEESAKSRASGNDSSAAGSSETGNSMEFGRARKVTIQGYDGDAMEPFISRDGEYLLFNNSNSPDVDTNLHYAQKIDNSTFKYKGEIEGINTDSLDAVPSIDAEGNIYFVSTRSYDETKSTIYRGKWDAGRVTDVAIVTDISKKKPGLVNFDVEVSADGKTMIFVDGVYEEGSALPKSADLVMAVGDPSGFKRDANSRKLLANINTDALEFAPCLSKDGLELFFTRAEEGGTPGIYRSRRGSVDDPFEKAQRLSHIEGFVEAPTLAPNEKSLYFHAKIKDRYEIYRVRRTSAR